MGSDCQDQDKRIMSHHYSGKPKCFYKYCISRRKSYVSPEPYPYVWTAPKSTDHHEWIHFICKLPPDYVQVQELSSKHRFCHLHFEERFIVKGNKYNVEGKTYEVPLSKWRLTPDAYPTLFDPHDLSRDPPRQQSVIKQFKGELEDKPADGDFFENQVSGSSTEYQVEHAELEIDNGSGSSIDDNSTRLNVNRSSPAQIGDDESLPSIDSESDSKAKMAQAISKQTPEKPFRSIAKVKNVQENSSSSLSLHDMVDIEIQTPAAAECELSISTEDCDQNVSRVLHTPPGDRDDLIEMTTVSINTESGSGEHEPYLVIDSNLSDDHVEGGCADPLNTIDAKDHDYDSMSVNESGDQNKAETQEQIVGDGSLVDSIVEEISIIQSEDESSSGNHSHSQSQISSTSSSSSNKRKRKQDLIHVNLSESYSPTKKCKAKNVEVIELDSDSEDSQSQESAIAKTTFTPVTSKLQPSILKRTIAKITTDASKQQHHYKSASSSNSANASLNLFPNKALNSQFNSVNGSLLQAQGTPVQKILPAVPNLNHQIILVRQSGPTPKNPVAINSGSTQTNTGPFVILGSPTLAGGASITLPIPVPVPVPGATNPTASAVQPVNNKLIIVRQPTTATTVSGSASNMNNSINSKKSLPILTARDLSLLTMPSPDWSVNTYPDMFSISETIMSQDRIEIIRKSITITSSNWLMKFSTFAHDVPQFSSGMFAGAGGISEVQQVLNRFATVSICSGLELDSKSSKRKYLDSRISQVRHLVRYDVDHNYRSTECPLVILKNSTHPLDTNTSLHAPIRKKSYEFILCTACNDVEKKLTR